MVFHGSYHNGVTTSKIVNSTFEVKIEFAISREMESLIPKLLARSLTVHNYNQSEKFLYVHSSFDYAFIKRAFEYIFLFTALCYGF